MYCSKCGKENNDSSKFCKYCGAELGQHVNANPVKKSLDIEISKKTDEDDNRINKILNIIVFAILTIIVILITTLVIYVFFIRKGQSGTENVSESKKELALIEDLDKERVEEQIEESIEKIAEDSPEDLLGEEQGDTEEIIGLEEEISEEETIKEEVNLIGLYGAYAEATSELDVVSKDNATYVAGNAIDGNYSTSWVEGVEGCGEGQMITLKFDQPHNISELCIYNGFLKDWARYVKNGKVITVVVDFCNGQAEQIDLNYNADLPEEEIPFTQDVLETCKTEIVLEQECVTDTINITIINAIPGSKYYDTAISEIEVYGY